MSMPAEIEDDLQKMRLYLSDTFTFNLACAGALTWLVYDTALSFGDEIKYMWRSRWTITKVLYFLARYYILLDLILYLSVNTNTKLSAKFCKSWIWFRGFNAPWSSAMIAESLFAFRIWAMYGRDRKIFAIVFCALLLDAMISAATIAVDMDFLKVFSIPPQLSAQYGLPALPGCLATTGPNHMVLVYISWSGTLALSFLYFSLTIYKLWYRPSHDTGSARHVKHQKIELMPLGTLVLRDGALYFFIIFAIVLLNFMFTIKLGQRALNQIAVSWLMAAYSILSCRLILNLRAQSAPVSNEVVFPDIQASSSSFQRRKLQLEDGTDIAEDVPLGVLSLRPMNTS